ncbi:uncharacterized protein CDAR_217571, partial [Caerostris darwini]
RLSYETGPLVWDALRCPGPHARYIGGVSVFSPCPTGLGNPFNLLRAWDRGLQLFPLNEEFPVSASHKLVLITSLPFVHTARRYYRLNDLVRSSDWRSDWPSWTSRNAGKMTKLDHLEEVKV